MMRTVRLTKGVEISYDEMCKEGIWTTMLSAVMMATDMMIIMSPLVWYPSWPIVLCMDVVNTDDDV